MSVLIFQGKGSWWTEEPSHNAVPVDVGSGSRPVVLNIHVKNVDIILVESGCTWYTSTSSHDTTLRTIINLLLLLFID